MIETDSSKIDRESRNRIISDINKNIFVEAGAGSGKTTMLVSRMAAMIEAGIDIKKICAITFTKAAANEFYERFQKLLIKRSDPELKWDDKGLPGQLPKPTEETRKLCEEALKNIDLCFMGTIDSFCNMILSEHPYEAEIPSDSILISEEEEMGFFIQEYVKICNGEYGEELKEEAKLYNSLNSAPKEVFALGLTILMDNRNVVFQYKKTDPEDVDKKYDSEKKALIKSLKCLLEHPELKYEGNKKRLEAWESIDRVYRNVQKNWNIGFDDAAWGLKTAKDLLVIKEALNHYSSKLEGVYVEKNMYLENDLGNDVLNQLKEYRYNISMGFLIRCMVRLEEVMRQKGYMTYFSYLFYLRNMLREDVRKGGNLIRHIYDRHSFFLIDEFQDTNPLQAEIFFYLTAENPMEKWYMCVPKQGSLFVVGDPKQSIYRFRGADVGSFLQVKELFEKSGGEILDLTSNFRSTDELRKYYNKVFKDLFAKESTSQCKFKEIPPRDENYGEENFSGIFKYKALTAKANTEISDPKQITKIIERLVDNENYCISDGDDLRKIQYRDIMVITPSKDKLAPIEEALNERNIPTRVEGNVPFEANHALKEAAAIFSAMADPYDAIAVHHAVSGKVIGISNEEIAGYKTRDGKITFLSKIDIDEGSDDETKHIVSELNKLNLFYKSTKDLSAAELFLKIIEHYRVYERVKAVDLEVLFYSLELLRNAEKSGSVLTRKQGADFLINLVKGGSKEERCLRLQKDKNAVHLANLHKVKGLEAPVVILSAASKSGNNTIEKRLEHEKDDQKGYLFALSQKGQFWNYIETSQFDEVKDEEKKAVLEERDRAAYVAATRAKNVLIICDSYKITGKGNESRDTRWECFLTNDLPDVFEEITSSNKPSVVERKTAVPSELYNKASEECVLRPDNRRNESSTYLKGNPSLLTHRSKVSENIENEEYNDTFVIDNSDENKTEPDLRKRIKASLLGTVTHRLMEMIVSSGDKFDTKSAVAEIVSEYLTEEYNEDYKKQLADSLAKTAEKIHNGGYPQIYGVPQDILGTLMGSDEVYCEVPFCYREEKNDGTVLWNGIMDVVYHADGKWHIVDYKTNEDGTGLDLKYKDQLDAYVKAFKEITGEEADAGIYHITLIN